MKKTTFSKLPNKPFNLPGEQNEEFNPLIIEEKIRFKNPIFYKGKNIVDAPSKSLELIQEQRPNLIETKNEELEPKNVFFDGFSPVFHSHAPEKLSKDADSFFETLINNIKSTDGFDDTAQLVGGFVHGTASPIVAASILTFAIPFTLLGVLGMKNEYEEAKHRFEQILSDQGEIKIKLQNLHNFSEENRRVLQEKFQLDLPENQDFAKDFFTDKKLDRISYEIGQYQSLKNKELIFQLVKKIGWTGFGGLTLMLGGVIEATASSGVSIANEINSSPALQSAIPVLNLASGATFLVAQVLLSAYGINVWQQGVKQNEALEKIEKTFVEHAQGFMQKSTLQNVQEIFAKQKKFTQKHSVEYGRSTALGQALMAGGTLAGMTGAGLIVSGPIFVLGTPLVFCSTTSRIIYQEKERKFMGKISEFVEEEISKLNPIHLFEKHLDKPVKKRHASILKELDLEFDSITTKLANVKALSLVHHLINDRSYFGKTSEEKLTKLQNRLNANQDFLKGSELEGSVIKKLKNFFDKNENEIKELLTLDKRQSNYKIRRLVPFFIKGEFDLNNPNLYYFESTNSNAPTLEKLNIPDFVRRDGEFKISSRIMIQKSKEALKALRFHIADSMARVTETIEVHQTLNNFNPIQEPQTSINATDSENLLRPKTLLFKPEIDSSSFWHQKNCEDNFRVKNGIYEGGLEEAKNTLLDIIIFVASSSFRVESDGTKSKMRLEDALTIIKKSKICGGTSNKIANNQIEFEQWEKDFSEKFQHKCKKCGILSFYEDKNLGLRSTHIPLEVVQKLEEITQNPTIDREQLSKNAMFGVNYIQ